MNETIQQINNERQRKYLNECEWFTKNLPAMDYLYRALKENNLPVDDFTFRQDSYSFDILATGDKKMLNAIWGVLRRHRMVPEEHLKDNRPYFTVAWNPEAEAIEEGLYHSGFCVYFIFSSTVCRRVQVRTEMQEVAVYEVRCD